MIIFSNKHISIAGPGDVSEITSLLNSAYRGESSKLGWTTEAHLIAGEQRTDEAGLEEVMKMANSIILKYQDEQQQIIGCVNLQQKDAKIYLGMLSVKPLLQAAGLGRALLIAAEEYAGKLACKSIYMTVFTARTELIDWYKRNGYTDTGERKPFIANAVTGKPLQPLTFLVLEKILA
jgi:ribosomal protein S18 acetylase RimI-like enzyme